MTGNGTFGVYSEVGKLRKVIVHRPDLSLRRLPPLTTTSCSLTTSSGSSTPKRSTTTLSRSCATTMSRYFMSTSCWGRRWPRATKLASRSSRR